MLRVVYGSDNTEKGADVVNVRLVETKGFTLIEIMIATLVFSVALMGIASLAVVVIRGNFISKQISTATALSQQKMEEYINKGYSNFSTGAVTENYGSITAADGSTALYSGYKRVSVIQNGPIANTRTLNVSVYRQSDNASASFSTIIAK